MSISINYNNYLKMSESAEDMYQLSARPQMGYLHDSHSKTQGPP